MANANRVEAVKAMTGSSALAEKKRRYAMADEKMLEAGNLSYVPTVDVLRKAKQEVHVASYHSSTSSNSMNLFQKSSTMLTYTDL